MSTSPYPLQFVRSGVGWGVFYQPSRGGGGAQTLGFSSDDGVTWTHGPRGGMPRVFAVDTSTENAVLGVWQKGNEIVQATDGFATREPWATFPDRVQAFIGNDDGSRFWVATEDGSLYRSRDGGQTWEDAGQTPRLIRENGLAVSHHDPTALFAINDVGEIWYFRDIGLTAPVQIP